MAPAPLTTPGKRAGIWEGRSTPGSLKASTTFSRTVVLSGKGDGVRLLLEKPLMRPIKWISRLWQGICALLRVVQAYRAFTWLRDHLDHL